MGSGEARAWAKASMPVKEKQMDDLMLITFNVVGWRLPSAPKSITDRAALRGLVTGTLELCLLGVSRCLHKACTVHAGGMHP